MAYCTVQDIREEGITAERATDTRLALLIDLATAYIDGITRQWFEPRAVTIMVDGTGGQTIFLPIFAIEVAAVTVDGLAVTDFKVYNRFFPDDRRNPKIYREAGWPRGRQNVVIAGTWGFVDKVGTEYQTPALIKQAAKRLVIRELPLLGDSEGQEDRKRSRIVSETTDGHSYTLERLVGTLDLTGDPDIDRVLALFRAPIAIGGV
ncbi:MAG: hypothetical protein HPY90_04515 [Syntrophothermus sp.]|uniref:hypothetical protein n=1 Tax=Syntrophothermus sp. TaxID=2736299 RepID=UPI00257C7A8C|nr:hypothetical protein [Syntrophothermus sp.]NSW82530.1 hypothetical protein [Syntrophothermus sp.]